MGRIGAEAVTDAHDGSVLGLDLGASRTRAAVVAADGRLVARTDGPTRRDDGPVAVIADAVAMLRAVLRQVAHGSAPVVAIGVSAPGPLDAARGVLVEPPNLGPAFRDIAIAEPLSAALSLPVLVERDTNVAALAEWEFGAARGATDFIYVTVSTGIGGGIVSGGRPLTGSDGAAGELGHLLVDLDGPPCGCGGRGHLEAVSSGTGIARAAEEMIRSDSAAGLAARRRANGRALDARDIAAAEEEGDPDAARIMERARRGFAESCVALANVFNPELIVVGGSVARSQGERWLEPARRRVAEVAFRIPRERLGIVPAALGDDVSLVGALPLVRRRLS
jgi:glucokinase